MDCIFLPVLYLLEIIFWHIKLWHFFFNQVIYSHTLTLKKIRNLYHYRSRITPY